MLTALEAFLAIQFHTTTLSLYQLALAAIGPQSEPQSVTSQFDWNEMSCAAMDAAEHTLNFYLSLPVGTELGFTNTQWVQLAFAMVILYRHTAKVSDPTQKSAFLTILSQLQLRISALSTPHVDSNGDRDTFSEFTRRVSQIQGLLDDRIDTSNKSIGDNGASTLDSGMNVSVNVSSTSESETLNLNSLILEDLLMDVDFSSNYLFEASVEQIMGNWI